MNPTSATPSAQGGSDIRSKNRRGFTAAPNWRVNDLSLDPFEFRLAVWLASHVDTYQERITRNSIAKSLGMSAGKVSAAMAALVEAGIVELRTVEVPQSEGGKRWIVLFDHAAWEIDPGHVVTRARSSGDQGPGHEVTDPGHVVTASIGDIDRRPSEEQQALTLSAHPSGEPDRFDEFWALYPRRTGKPEARKRWAKITRKTDPQVILDGLAARVDWWSRARTEREFIPHPTTWLNQGRWEDEIEPLPEQAAATAAQRMADLDARAADELQTALDAGNIELAWRITRGKLEAKGSLWLVEIIEELEGGRSSELIKALVKRDGRPVDDDDIRQAGELIQRLRVGAGLTPGVSLALPDSTSR